MAKERRRSVSSKKKKKKQSRERREKKQKEDETEASSCIGMRFRRVVKCACKKLPMAKRKKFLHLLVVAAQNIFSLSVCFFLSLY